MVYFRDFNDSYCRIYRIQGFMIFVFKKRCMNYILLHGSPQLINHYLHLKFQVNILSSSGVMRLFKDFPYSRIYGFFTGQHNKRPAYEISSFRVFKFSSFQILSSLGITRGDRPTDRPTIRPSDRHCGI